MEADNVKFSVVSDALEPTPVLTGSSAARRRKDGAQFLAATVAIALVVVAGFGKSYFFRFMFPHQESLTLLVHIHGALMTAWIVLLVVQAALVAIGRTDVHRRVGRLGAVLLGVIAVVALPTTLAAARLGGNHMPGPPIPALALVFGMLLAFLILASLGLYMRRRPDYHKRLMIVSSIAAMEAGTSP